MSNQLKLIIYFSIIINCLSASVDIECEYKTDNYYKFGDTYECKVTHIPNITTYESAQIASITGLHKSLKSDDDVTGFHSNYNVMHYFPRDFEKFFKNLELVFIEFAGLKEIHQADLKPLQKLISLYLGYNSIEVLEAGLFDANPNLEMLSFVANDIVHIEPNVFDSLPKLRCLYMAKTCIDNFAYSKDEVMEAIDAARNKCISADYVFMSEKIVKLETESKFLNPEEFTENYEKFEKSFEKSKFYNFSTLRIKFDGLRNYTVDLRTKSLCRKGSNFVTLNTYDFEVINTTTDMKISYLIEHMKDLVAEGLGLNDKLSKIDGKFSKFEAKMSKKLSKIDKEIETTRSRVDAKLKKIESNFMEKVGEIVEEKLRKILDEKLEEILNAKIRD